MNIKQKWRHFFIRSLRVDILTAFLGLLIISSVSIISFIYTKDAKMIIDFSEDYMEKVSEVAMHETMSLLGDAEEASEVGAQIVNFLSDISLENQDLLDYMFAVLKYNEYFDSYYMGTIDGSFLMVTRFPEDPVALAKLPEKPPPKSYFRIRFIDRTQTPVVDTQIYYDRSGEKIAKRVDHDPEFDPRVRPWYVNVPDKDAKKWSTSYTIGVKNFVFFRKQAYWTKVYVFKILNTSGITVSDPVFTAEGKFIGMFGTDLSLDGISEFLKHQKIGKTGKEIIMTPKGEIIAGPDLISEKKRLGVHTMPTVFNVKNTVFKYAFEKYKETKKNYFVFKINGEKYLASLNDFPIRFQKDWVVLITVPLDDLLGSLIKNHTQVLFISLGILVMAIFALVLLSKRISKPIVKLAHAIDDIRNFNLDQTIDVRSNIKEIILISEATVAMQSAIKSFSYFVPKQLVQKLITQGADLGLGGKSRRLAIFFSDIQDFTKIAENMSPEDLMLYLSKLLDEMSRIIIDQKGTIDKYIGDSVMAFWGAPEEDNEKAFRAATAALHSIHAIAELNNKWKSEGKPAFHIRIGLHEGDVIVGNIGTFERRNYTIIGDEVNLTSRLEGLNRVYGTSIIISEAFYNVIKDKFLTRPLDRVMVKGKEEVTKIFELIGQYEGEDFAKPSQETIEIVGEFEKAYNLFLEQKWGEAAAGFEKILTRWNEDGPSKMYLEQARAFEKNPPGPDWNGMRKMDLK